MSKAECATSIVRRDERTHLFIIATLYFGGASIPVRVRNLSDLGALIEGASLPPVGTEISLRRGSLQAKGIVVWTSSGQAGLSFSLPVTVSSWLPTKEPSRQRQIEQYVFGSKHVGQADSLQDIPIEDAKSCLPPVVAGLEYLQVELSHLADKLSQDVILVATHPEVQFLDEAVQRIGKIVEAVKMQEKRKVPSGVV